jgi:CDGSH-type Zn-finger protein
MTGVTIIPTDNGPYLVHGSASLIDAEGQEYEVTDTIALCRCGHSRTKPFCDGSHETVSFQATQRAEHTLVPPIAVS